MNSLACGICIVLFSLVTIFTLILFNSNPSQEHIKAINNASSLTKLPNISLSTPFIETRIKEYDDFSNNFYLGMKKDTYSGFIYAK